MCAEKRDIKRMLPEELREYFRNIGEPPFRAKQVFKWLWTGARSFNDMTNLPKTLRDRLESEFFITVPDIAKKRVSDIDGTIKYLWTLRDGETIESVVMSYRYGETICVSSQVGCKMGCRFCASTIGGKARNLSAGEIADQVLFAELDSGRKIGHVVMMGIGEPLDNFDETLRFFSIANEPDGLNIGMRHITVSTCGITENIDALADKKLQITLSLSLHGADDETRSQLMPVNRAYGVDKVLGACRRYFDATGRRVTFEYAMVKDVNDSPEQAELLAEKIKGAGSHVNLIPLNNVDGSELEPSGAETVRTFKSILENHGINVTVRRRLGPDINAACGQLRREKINK